MNNKTFPHRLRLLAPILSTIVMLPLVFIVTLSLKSSGYGTAAMITLFSAAMIFASYFAFKSEGLTDSPVVLSLIYLSFAGALLLRLSNFDYKTLDYINFLAPWIERIKAGGGLVALKEPIGNYNIPYLLYLAVISYFPVNDLYLIKLLSVFFDFVLALFLMKLVAVFTGDKTKKLVCFILALFLPTPILNGSLWGQCDSIYAAFAIMSLYFGLRSRPVLSISAMAISFAFKLQAIFMMPVLLLLLIVKRIRLQHLPLFPVVYFIAVCPAIIAGRPVLDTLFLYFSELGTVGGGLNYNSPSVYSLFSYVENTELLSKLGILAAFALCILLFTLCFLKRRETTNKTLLSAAFIFVIGIPLLLPHMHDRYFFIADIIALSIAVIYPKYLLVVPLTSFASLLGYHAYLKMRYLLPMSYGFFSLCIALIVIFCFFVKSFSSDYTGKSKLT